MGVIRRTHRPGKSQRPPGISPGGSPKVLLHAGQPVRHDPEGAPMNHLGKITAAVSTVALAGAGGLGIAQSATAAKDSSSRSARPGPGPRGGGPMSSARLAAIAKTLGVTSAQLKAALDAARPAPPTGTRPSLAADLASALDVDVAKVREILDANRPARPAAGERRARGARPQPDRSKLVAALASGLGIDAATVAAAFDEIEAAHKAARAAREQALYEAVATQLGLTADAVKGAFEANRPAKPAR